VKRLPAECGREWVKVILYLEEVRPDRWRVGARKETEQEIEWGEPIWPSREAAAAHVRSINEDFEKRGLGINIPPGDMQ
jgi:hypothetical protein